MSVVRVVLIGYGFLGRYHAEKVLLCAEQAQLVAIVDAFEGARNEASKKYPSLAVYEDIADLPVGEYDAGIIATQTSVHKQVLDYLLENEKHVFCEKPMVSSYADALLIRDQVPDRVVVQVGHSERYHRCFNRQFASNVWNLAGDILSDSNALVQFRRLAVFKDGRGMDVSIEKDLMVHDLDLADLLFNVHDYPVENIQVHTTKMLTPVKPLESSSKGQIHDHVNVRLACTGRPTLEFEAGRGFHSETRKIVFWSRYGTMTINLLKKKIDIVRNGKPQTINYPAADHLLLEQQEFYTSILTGELVKVTPEVACGVLKILDVIEKST